jgi:hypothetical protein
MAQAVTTEAQNGSSGFRFALFLSKFTDTNLHQHVQVPRTSENPCPVRLQELFRTKQTEEQEETGKAWKS